MMERKTQNCVAAYLLTVLSLIGLLAVDRGTCQHYYLLRPIPSDSLPLVELREDPDPALDPREKDLNETELRAALGGFLDGRFVSVHPPEDKYTAGNEESAAAAAAQLIADDYEILQKPVKPSSSSSSNIMLTMPKEIKAVDFDVQLQGVGGMTAMKAKHSKPSKKLKRRLQQWLWAYSFCPLVHTWSDLGARFWPRFVRSGSCLSRRSCSVPEGMLCKPSGSAHVTVLRWRCVSQQQSRRVAVAAAAAAAGGLKCAWIPVQYPIITECKCSCSN